VATSPVYRDSLSEILNTWTLEDLADALLVISTMEGAEPVKGTSFEVE
jgi:hypothetical protein